METRDVASLTTNQVSALTTDQVKEGLDDGPDRGA